MHVERRSTDGRNTPNPDKGPLASHTGDSRGEGVPTRTHESSVNRRCPTAPDRDPGVPRLPPPSSHRMSDTGSSPRGRKEVPVLPTTPSFEWDSTRGSQSPTPRPGPIDPGTVSLRWRSTDDDTGATLGGEDTSSVTEWSRRHRCHFGRRGPPKEKESSSTNDDS